MTFLQKLLRIQKKVVFRKPRGVVGMCEPGQGGRIFIALKARRVCPAQIYLHELIHHQHCDWSEKRVLAMERHLWRKSTPHERYLLYRKLFLHKFSKEEES